MGSIYDSYASQTGAATLDHLADVRRVAEHFRNHLLPALPDGVDITTCSVFEFGAGWGRNLLALAELGVTNLYGVDISEEQVAIGRDLSLQHLELASNDKLLPESAKSVKFDIVLAFDVLEHLDLDALYRFSRLAREIIAPNGLLIVQVPNALALFNPVLAGDLTHLRGFTLASLRQMLILSGTEPFHLGGVPFPGRGKLRAVRLFLGRTLIAPFVRLLSWTLYGRAPEQIMVEPNLLGIGRASQEFGQ